MRAAGAGVAHFAGGRSLLCQAECASGIMPSVTGRTIAHDRDIGRHDRDPEATSGWICGLGGGGGLPLPVAVERP